MKMVEHGKCQKCGKVSKKSELIPNPDGVGKICTDTDACNAEQKTVNIKT